MSATQLLALMLLLMTAAAAAQAQMRLRRVSRLRALAQREGFHFSAVDQFDLAAKVARHFPVEGAADLRVSDLLYRSGDDGHKYIFTADYTRGVVGSKRRVRAVVMMIEVRPAAGRSGEPVLQLTDSENASELERYAAMVKAMAESGTV